MEKNTLLKFLSFVGIEPYGEIAEQIYSSEFDLLQPVLVMVSGRIGWTVEYTTKTYEIFKDKLSMVVRIHPPLGGAFSEFATKAKVVAVLLNTIVEFEYSGMIVYVSERTDIERLNKDFTANLNCCFAIGLESFLN